MSDYIDNKAKHKLLAEGDTAYAELSALFDQLRANEPEFSDDNFTKMVMNSLPPRPSFKTKQYSRRGLSLDIIGLAAGIGVTLWYVSPTELLSSIAAAIPESVVLTPTMLGIGFVAVCGASLLAWFGTEHSTI